MPLQAVTHAGACRGPVHDEAEHGKEAEEEREKQQGQDRKGEEGRKEEKGESQVEQEGAEGIEGREEGAGCLEALVNEAERLQIGIASPAIGSGGWGGGGWGGRGNVAEQGNDRGWEEGRGKERQPQPSPDSATSNLANPQPSPCRAFPSVVRAACHSPSAPMSSPGGKGVQHAMPSAGPYPPCAFPPSSSLPHHRADGPTVDAFQVRSVPSFPFPLPSSLPPSLPASRPPPSFFLSDYLV